ncbi:MAG: hypothetical protein JWP18_687 [Solirubrobacterales bacterium]|jgi:hypothetical protein|nr:hypothetical protein [Solirubrobacterales bacterium]
MSQLEKPVPPAGEDIHLPGGSLHPLLLTLGITMALIGATVSPLWLSLPGSILTIAVIIAWVQGARREMASLPATHGEHH